MGYVAMLSRSLWQRSKDSVGPFVGSSFRLPNSKRCLAIRLQSEGCMGLGVGETVMGWCRLSLENMHWAAS